MEPWAHPDELSASDQLQLHVTSISAESVPPWAPFSAWKACIFVGYAPDGAALLRPITAHEPVRPGEALVARTRRGPGMDRRWGRREVM